MGVTRLQPGACCGCGGETGGDCEVTICLTACFGNILVAGATVTILSGATTLATGTTGDDGCVTLSISSGGSKTVTVSATGYLSNSQTRTLVCDGTITIGLFPDSTHVCPCDDCPNLVPTTLGASDGLGPITLTYQAPFWVGCEMRPMAGCVANSDCSDCGYTESANVPVIFLFGCGSVPGTYAMAVLVPACGGAYIAAISDIDCATAATIGGSVLCSSSGLQGPASSCAPFEWSASWTGPPLCDEAGCVNAGVGCNCGSNPFACQIYGCGGPSFTVTP